MPHHIEALGVRVKGPVNAIYPECGAARMSPDPVPHVAPREVADRLQRNPEAFMLLDVREPFELELASVPGAVNVPLQEIPGRLGDIPKDKPVIVMCHHGMRSLHAASWLRQQGVDAINLRGGIDAYAREADPDVGNY